MNSPFRIAIIGAGFSGLCMAIKLKAAGYSNVTVFERAADLGGTWRDNTYPGCACDVPSHLYSYSFEMNPNWSRAFSPWIEIARYLQHCVDKYGLRSQIRFNTEITELRFHGTTKMWSLRTRAGAEEHFHVVISGTGPLNKPDLPNIVGRETFTGKAFHSSHWDHDYALAGKRVAVIGTGASAIQIVPNIATQVAELTLFQRTPPWVLPRMDRAYRAWEKLFFRWCKPWLWLHRKLLYWRLEHFGVAVLNDGHTRRFFEGVGRWFLKKQIADAALREKLAPNYRIGCKRALISDDYYPSLNRANVEVVTDAITEITPTGVRTQQGREITVDAIIYGTGFRATEFLTPMRIYSADNRELSEVWRTGASTYLGITLAEFPNLFLLVGPNTGLGHNSIIFMIEAQVHYVIECLKRLTREGRQCAALKPAVQQQFSTEIQQRLRGTTWLSGCKSWYLSADGNSYTMWPGYTVEYWWRTRKFEPEQYEIS